MKLWNYLYLMAGLSIIFELAGLVTSGGLLSAIGYSRVGSSIVFNFSLSTFASKIQTVLAGAVLGGVFIGLFTRSSPENYIIIGAVTGGTLTLFLQVMTQIVLSAGSAAPWIRAVIMLILAPFMVGFISALLEFFRGTD